MEDFRALRKVVFYISFPLSFMGFILPIYATSIGASLLEVGLMYSVFSLFSILVRPLVGKLIDTKGRKIGIIIGSSLYCLANLFYFSSKDVQYLLLARVFQSMGGAFLWISVSTIISDRSQIKNRSEIFGLINQSVSKGEILGAFIGFVIIYNFYFENSFKMILFIYLALGFVSLYYSLIKVEETIDLKADENREVKKREGDRKTFLVIVGLFSFITSMAAPIYLIYIKENIADSLSLIGVMYIPSGLFSLFLPKIFGQISDKKNREKIVFAGIFISGVLRCFLPFINKYYFFMIFHTLIALVSMFYAPAKSALIAEIVGEEERGKNYGIYQLAMGIGGSIGPIIGSYVYEKTSNGVIFYISGGLLMVLCIVGARFYPLIKRD